MNHIELEISNPCNEHCVHCFRHCLNSKTGFLSLKSAKNILEQAKKLGAKKVTITGGEATLNPKWKEIVKTAENLDFEISFFTNGLLLTEDDANFFATLKNLNEVQLSLYSLNEKNHDDVTNIKGSCAKTKKAIEILKERNVPIFISIPAMQNNKTSFADVMRWADKNNINSCADLWIFGTSDYKNSNRDQKLSTTDLEFFFNETMKNNGELSYVWGNGLNKTKLSEINFYGAITNSLCINGNGDIFPKIGWYEKLGNIENNSLKEVYEKHPLLQEIRKIKASDITECANCKDSDFCDFCPSPHLVANNGELNKLDKDYCHFVHLRKGFAMKRDYIEFLRMILNKRIDVQDQIIDIEGIGKFIYSMEERQYEENLSFEKVNCFILTPFQKKKRIPDVEISLMKKTNVILIFGIKKKQIENSELENHLVKLQKYYDDDHEYIKILETFSKK